MKTETCDTCGRRAHFFSQGNENFMCWCCVSNFPNMGPWNTLQFLIDTKSRKIYAPGNEMTLDIITNSDLID